MLLRGDALICSYVVNMLVSSKSFSLYCLFRRTFHFYVVNYANALTFFFGKCFVPRNTFYTASYVVQVTFSTWQVATSGNVCTYVTYTRQVVLIYFRYAALPLVATCVCTPAQPKIYVQIILKVSNKHRTVLIS